MPARTLLSLTIATALSGALTLPALAAPSPAAKKPTPVPSLEAATAPVELVEDAGPLKINWTTGTITVAGVGVGGDRGSMQFRRTLSSRSAVADAYRRLASGLELVRVDANTRLKDLAVSDDALRSRLNDFVKSAKVLETNYWPDGSAEVILGVDLKGPGSLQALIAGTTAAEPVATGEAAMPSPSPRPAKEIVTAPQPMRATYSSVIVDARSLGAQPALLPNLRDAENKVITLAPGPNRAPVRYLDEGAEFAREAGVNPLKLRASRTEGLLRADLLLTPDAAKALKEALMTEKVGAETPVFIVL